MREVKISITAVLGAMAGSWRLLMALGLKAGLGFLFYIDFWRATIVIGLLIVGTFVLGVIVIGFSKLYDADIKFTLFKKKPPKAKASYK